MLSQNLRKKNKWGGIEIDQYKNSLFKSCALMNLRLLTNMSARKIDNILSRLKRLTYIDEISTDIDECGYTQPRVEVAINMPNKDSIGLLLPPSVQILDNDETLQHINQYPSLFFDIAIENPVLKFQNKHFILVPYMSMSWGLGLYEVTKNKVLLETPYKYGSEPCGS